MKKKMEICAYCQKRRKTYQCSMLSGHCKDCCVNNCSGKKKRNLIHEAFMFAREMGGSSWPSADCTCLAMNHLIAQLVSHFEKSSKTMSPKKIAKEIMSVCGIKAPSKRKILEDAVQKAEAHLQ